MIVANTFMRFCVSTLILVTMALVESEVAFQRRCDELEPGLYDKFKGTGHCFLSPLWHFALGSPQNQVNDSELSELAAKIHGGDTTVGNTANIRRLHFEACTFLMADMKNPGGIHRPVRAGTQAAFC